MTRMVGRELEEYQQAMGMDSRGVEMVTCDGTCKGSYPVDQTRKMAEGVFMCPECAACSECGAPGLRLCVECGNPACKRHTEKVGDRLLCEACANRAYNPPAGWRGKPAAERAAHLFANYYNARKMLVAEGMAESDIVLGAKYAAAEREVREAFRVIYGDARYGSWAPEVQGLCRAAIEEAKRKCREEKA